MGRKQPCFASLIPKNTTSKNHFLFSTFLMRDVYKDDFRDVARVFDVLFVKNLFDR